MKQEFEWNDELGLATCTLTNNKGQQFYGVAECHDDDLDFKSEKTGCEIALRRAALSALRHQRDGELIPELNILKHLYNNISQSKKFDPKSYEVKMLKRQIYFKEAELADIRDVIHSQMADLYIYLKSKDIFYKQTRAHRKEKELEKANLK